MRVRRRRFLVAVLAASLFGAACDGGATNSGTSTTSASSPATSTTVTTAPPRDAPWAGVPEVRDVAEYATGLGISKDEAQRRNALVEAFHEGALFSFLDNRSDYAYWVEETAEAWTLVVGRTRIPDALYEVVETRTAGTPIEGLVEIRELKHDLAELRRIERRIADLIYGWCLPQSTKLEIDYPRNMIVLGVQSLSGFFDVADVVWASLRGVDAVSVEELPVDDPPGANTVPCEPPLRELAEARERWASHDLDRYAYRVTASAASFGSVDVGEVMVWDGDVTEVLPPDLLPSEPFYPARFAIRYGTVERLFDIVESNPVQWMNASFDPEWGFPTAVSFDDRISVDEEWGFEVEDFRVLESPPEPQPPREDRSAAAGSLEIELFFPQRIAVVDAVIGQTAGVFRPDNGWRHTIEVTSFVYASPGVEPIDPGPLGVIDRAGRPAPRALLHRAGDSAVDADARFGRLVACLRGAGVHLRRSPTRRSACRARLQRGTRLPVPLPAQRHSSRPSARS